MDIFRKGYGDLDRLEGARFYQGNHSEVGIILLHAYTGSPMDVNLLANRLKREGYQVLSPLFAGHGSQNIYDLFEGNIEIWQQQTRDAIAWMTQRDYRDLFLFGLSMGGLLASWALCQDDFALRAGGIFNSPVITQRPINIQSAFDQFAQTLYQNKFASDYQTVRQDILKSHRAQIQEIESFKESLRPLMSQLKRPYFIAQSLQDELINPNDAAILAQALPDNLVAYHEYPENTHVITVNPQRSDFEKDLLEFIDQNRSQKKGGYHESI